MICTFVMLVLAALSSYMDVDIYVYFGSSLHCGLGKLYIGTPVRTRTCIDNTVNGEELLVHLVW